MKIALLPTTYHRFAFQYDYKPDIVSYCRLLKESWGWDKFNFDGPHKAWVFSDPKIVDAIQQRYPQVVVEDGVKEACGLMIEENRHQAKRDEELARVKKLSDTDLAIPGLKIEPYPFQKVGIKFVMESKGRAYIGDEPGLGKTLQAIGVMLLKGCKRNLVVCPATMKYVWAQKVREWTDLKPLVIDSDTDIDGAMLDTDVLVINYELLKKHLDTLVRQKFGFGVFDEAHYIKNPAAQRSRAARTLTRYIDDVLFLSGTPVLNRPVELYTSLSLIDPAQWGSYYSFVYKYCGARQTPFGLDVSGSTNIGDLKEKIARYFIRRTKDEVLKDLPEKVRTEVPVDLDSSWSKNYNKAYHEFIKYLRENKGRTNADIKKAMMAETLVRLNLLREISAAGKVSAAAELIDNLIESGQKVIVFSSFLEPLRELRMHYKPSEAVVITGETSNEDRFKAVESFQKDPNVKVFFGGIKSAGVGITLTEASNVIFLDYAWTPSDHRQAEDRAHRIGSTHSSVNIYQLHSRGTIDDTMQRMLARKAKVVDTIMGDDDKSTFQFILDDLQLTVNNK